MEWTCPEIASSNRQRMVEELLQGREMANQLQRCISGDVLSAEGLVKKILGSFTNTIRILNGIHETNKEELISQIQSNSATCSPVIGPAAAAAAGADLEKLISQMQFNSITTSVTTTAWGVAAGADYALDPAVADLEKLEFNSITTSLTTAWGADKAVDGAVKSDVPNVGNYGRAETLNIRRGHFKRRTETQNIRRACLDRRKTSCSWTKDTLGLVDDGHAWRKYGQKTTLNSRHPRNYFRCTNKYDQGCKATKHVQMINDEPELFRTTYYDNHTCFDYLKARELIVDSSDSQDPSDNMIKFDTANDYTCKQHPFFTSFTTIKRERAMEEEMIAPINDHDHVTRHNQSLLLCDHLMSPDLGLFDSPGSISVLSSTITYDHDDDLISRIMEGCFDGHEEDFPYEY